jgi:hypothetical protein
MVFLILGQNPARQTVLKSGLPDSVTATVNQVKILCSETYKVPKFYSIIDSKYALWFWIEIMCTRLSVNKIR